MMRHAIRSMVVMGLLAVVGSGQAEDAFFRVAWSEMELLEGTTLPSHEETTWRNWTLRDQKRPYAVLDGEGEVYVSDPTLPGGGLSGQNGSIQRELVLRTAAPRDVTGRLFAPTSDGKSMVTVRFKIPANRANRESRQAFYEFKQRHYERLLAQSIPGAAWFRHEARQAQWELGRRPGDVVPVENVPRAGRWAPTGELADTYALFTGGRAMSENLQLDRVLPSLEERQETVELSSLEGIDIREIDWKPLLEGLQPELDPLAYKIPADQHAVFFPSFNAAVRVADELTAHSAVVLGLAEPRSTNAGTFERYQQQLCLSLSSLTRLLGPTVVQSVAMTGSDPYFRTGTDVAVLLETADSATLQNLLWAQVALAAGARADAKSLEGEVDGLSYRGVVTPDRSLSCYIAKMDQLVIVANSLHQLHQLVNVTSGKVKSLAALDEFLFFRARYPRHEEDESALVFLSDATIRRWCGPRWRIATSRRTRDAAVVAELQATQLDRLVSRQVEPGPLYTDLPIAKNGELTLTHRGVRSSSLGSLDFMTPLAEMHIERVTQAEAEAYRQWRERYQQIWRWAFDPIALRLTVKPERLAMDLSIMPLIWGTEYRSWIGVSQGAVIAPDAGDPHDALAHVILAINTQSETLQRQSNFAQAMTGGLRLDPLGWLGNSVSLYLDDSPFWDELAKVETEQREEFLEEQGWRVPLAIQADVASGWKLTGFLAALRGFIEQVAPGMLAWESLTYHEQPYVKITPTERAIGQAEPIRKLAIYYSVSGKSFTISLNEDVLQRAIDRELERGKAVAAGQPPAPPRQPWMGQNVALQFEQKVLQVLAHFGRSEYQRLMQTRAWSNLPILNEWKRRYPTHDPVALHEEFWHTRLICPGGGQYAWNEDWQTMESTVYGCPAAPREGPIASPVLTAVKFGNFGLTFEEQGLRARVSLER
ncbi:MAG: hypothetical protein ACYC0X_24975 [Pirellulaceae bacterium]